MGIPRHPPKIMRWMSTLGWMKAEGVRVRRVCQTPCPYWIDEDLDALIAQLGADFYLVDERPPCPLCTRLNLFVASAGKGTPFRPCQTENWPQSPMPADGWPEWPDR